MAGKTIFKDALAKYCPTPSKAFSRFEALLDGRKAKRIANLTETLEKSVDGKMRADATTKLGDMRDVRAVPALVRALDGEEYGTWIIASQALAKIVSAQGEGATALLLEGFSNPNELIRYRIISTLDKMNDAAAIPGLLNALNDPDENVRCYAAGCLGPLSRKNEYRSGNIDMVPSLIEALADPHERVRGAAVSALGWTRDLRAVSELAVRLVDRDNDVRKKAAEALGDIRDAAAVPKLLDALNDWDSGMRLKAVTALGQIGDEKAVPRLVKALEKASIAERDAIFVALMGAAALPNRKSSALVANVLMEFAGGEWFALEAEENSDKYIRAAEKMAGVMDYVKTRLEAA